MLLLLLMLVLLGQSVTAPTARANHGSGEHFETFTWTGYGLTKNWSDSNNWYGGVVPPLTGLVELIFPSYVTGTMSINDMPNYTANTRMRIEAENYTIIGNQIPINEIDATYSSGYSLIFTPLALAPTANQPWTSINTVAGGKLVIAGSISGPGALSYNPSSSAPSYEAGTVELADAVSGPVNHTYNGNTIICRSCTVIASIPSAFGTTEGKTYLEGTIDLRTVSAEPLELGQSVNAPAISYLRGGSADGEVGLTGNIVLNKRLLVSVEYEDDTLSLSGALSGSSGITKDAPGTLKSSRVRPPTPLRAPLRSRGAPCC